jgi:hypothetical protein
VLKSFQDRNSLILDCFLSIKSFEPLEVLAREFRNWIRGGVKSRGTPLDVPKRKGEWGVGASGNKHFRGRGEIIFTQRFRPYFEVIQP